VTFLIASLSCGTDAASIGSGVVFFRFGAALALVVVIALCGTGLETQNLWLKRSLCQQKYRLDVLIESQAAIRLETQRLGAPAKLFQALEQSSASLRRPAKALRNDRRRASLLNWSDDSPSLESALQ